MPPVPEEGASPAKLLGDNWEAHVDKDSGRKYYFNKETRETSWKPPRISKGNNSGSDKVKLQSNLTYPGLEIKLFSREPNFIFKSYLKVLCIETSRFLGSLQKFEGATGEFKGAPCPRQPLISSPAIYT